MKPRYLVLLSVLAVFTGPMCAQDKGTLCGAGDGERRLSQGFRFLAVGGDTGSSASVKEAVPIGRKFGPKP